MSGIDPETPWIPADADQEFDPLEYAEIHPLSDRPMVVTPGGGDREVGRSCYQVDTEFGTYPVDCGLNQGDGDDYPGFRGLGPKSIDAVFLTHAHIDLYTERRVEVGPDRLEEWARANYDDETRVKITMKHGTDMFTRGEHVTTECPVCGEQPTFVKGFGDDREWVYMGDYRSCTLEVTDR